MDTTDDYLALRTRDLSRFMLGWCGKTLVDLRCRGKVVDSVEVDIHPDQLVLTYTYDQSEKIADPIPIEYSPCHFGGRRPWFICPTCKKRKTVLFCWRYFRCATCLGLSYASLQEIKADRPLNRLMRQRRKLGGSGALFEPFPPKPKGMRWDTYLELRKDEERNLGPFLDHAHAARERSVSLVARRVEKRAKQEAPTPKKPKPATTARALSPEELALALKAMELRPPSAKPRPAGS